MPKKGKRQQKGRRPSGAARESKIASRDDPTKHGASPARPRQLENNNFLLVALGASAGGLEAVKKLLAALPARTGFAFVFIQHLDPTHESMLVDLLKRHTSIDVLQAAEGMPVERNCLYVIPPQALLSVRDGLLRLSEPEARAGLRMPLDFFLHSMAQEYGERAVCVILSGTGTDGSIGLKAVSENGGLVIAQNPEEAGYSGMPRSAILTGAVNLVLPAARIPRALIRYAQHPYVTAHRKAVQPDEEASELLKPIVDLLRSQTEHDFRHYKKATLLRRIRRRMAIAGVHNVDDYVDTLRSDSRELDLLAKDLLIHVTSFFRDPAAYEALAGTVIPELVQGHRDDQPIRVWVPACSSGEEAYSIAMLFFEEFAAAKRSLKLQIFASDISAEAVAQGRNGLYPDSIRTVVSAERLARFFTREQQGWRVSRDLRDSIVFTVHDILTDPPFSHLDLVTCRNLLIYLQPNEQEKVLTLFHFALREGGYLFLGTSETIGKLTDHFAPVSDTLRIFRRIGPVQPRGRTVTPLLLERGRSLWPRLATQVDQKRPGIGDIVRELLLEAYAPAAVLVNRKYQGLYFFGATDRYLRVTAGEPSRDIPAMLRNGLPAKFRAAVRQASQSGSAVTISGGQIKRNGDTVPVSISARPVEYEGEDLLLVTFADEPRGKATRVVEAPAELSRVEQLEQELDNTRRELEDTIRDLQNSNQELTSLNEEAVSLNEEFQSTNEELESSREELQSLNEELTTVNSQLQEALERERKISDDLKNIMNSSDIATLFLDRSLKVRVFTPAAAPLFNLIATDVGRPLADLASGFIGADLLADARAVLADLAPIKREVKSETGVWYLCSITPYRTQEDRIEGVVIDLADIADIKAGEASVREARAFAESIINTVTKPLVVLDRNLHVVSASRSFYRYFDATPADTLGRSLPDTDARHLDIPALRAFLDRIKGGDRTIENFEVLIDLPPHGRRTLAITVDQMRRAGLDTETVLMSFDDITSFKQAEQELVEARRTAEMADRAKSRFLAAASHDLRQPLQTLSMLHGALKRHVSDAEGRMLLDKAERAFEVMTDMLTALLDINQIETGKIEPKFSDFAINKLFDSVAAEFADQARNKGLGWRLVRSGLAVRSDRRLLVQMVRNLLSNAVRYTDKGKILLGCRRRGDMARIEVWDTGIGISEEQVPRIFQEYQQLDVAGQRGGIGLGLSIVQHLGELLGCPIAVRSQMGRGSVFSIEVPLARAGPGEMPPAEGERRATGAKRLGAILVVEDEPLVRESITAMLRAEGHRVTAVASGEAALAVLANISIRPELIISDFNLPGEMNGVQTALALRSALGREMPAIILTGEVTAETHEDVIRNGLFSVTKPAQADVLSQLVQRLLAGLQRVRDVSAVTQAAGPQALERDATIYVVDDDPDVRDAMQTFLQKAGYRVETFPSAAAFLGSQRSADRGCLVVDVRMPGMSGLEMLARLAGAGGTLPAIVVTGHGDVAMAVQAMRGGAADFIEKPVDPEELVAAIDRALRQAAGPEERSGMQAAAAMRAATLTPREREVMDLVVAGHGNKEVAHRLGINQRTVETHRAAVMKKLGARSLSDLVRLAIAAGEG